jgi:hypothetical protein
MRHKKTISKFALASAKVIFNLLAVSAEIAVRSNFGVRYAGTLLAGYFLFVFYMLAVQGVSQKNLPFLDLYLVFLSVRLVGHLIKMCQSQSRIVHSLSSGTSWSLWQSLTVKLWLVQLVFEPGLLILVGWLIQPRDQALASWLVASAGCLFVKNSIFQWKQYFHLLDVVDSRIEGEQMSEAVRRHTAPPPRAAGGVNPVMAAEQPPLPPQPLERIFNNLDQTLRNLFSTDAQNPSAAPASQRSENSQTQKHDDGPLGHLPRITSRRNKT